MLKKPEQCQNMNEIRESIDEIDSDILNLLGKRLKYVHRAADIKKSENLIRDSERIDSMLQERELWAANQGYDASFIRKMFNDLIEYSISKELEVYKQK